MHDEVSLGVIFARVDEAPYEGVDDEVTEKIIFSEDPLKFGIGGEERGEENIELRSVVNRR